MLAVIEVIPEKQTNKRYSLLSIPLMCRGVYMIIGYNQDIVFSCAAKNKVLFQCDAASLKEDLVKSKKKLQMSGALICGDR